MERRIQDSLTGIPTMTCFFAGAEAERRRLAEQERPFSVLFFDLNGMKLFNSLFGYAEGDALLKAFANLLARHFGAEKVCRFGQDHFAAFTGETEPSVVLERLFADAAALNEGRTLPIHVGIYRDVPEAVEVPTVCDRAKMACDRLRSTYASGYRFFDETILTEADERRYVLDNLDRAIREKWIHVYYQPIVRSANGCICDEEALSRWIDPEKGMLSPGKFIPVLEDSRMIYKLDLYMVEQVLAEMKIKEERGLFIVPVSVNISRADFETCSIVDEIDRRVTAAGIRRDLMNIEITESAVSEDPAYMKEQIDRFRALGYHVWMDDFGSGYSSLDLLQRFDFDLIKFDLTFLRQFHQYPKSRIILSQLMKMAPMLGVDTVVEGVETEEHFRFLRSIGCDKLQGMYYHRPIPLEEIIALQNEPGGLQFEDPRQTDYYCAVGTANLSDPAFIDHKANQAIRPFLHSVPMAILELDGETVKLLRCNTAYGELLRSRQGVELPERDICDIVLPDQPGEAFVEAMRRCRNEEQWLNIHAGMIGDLSMHSMIRRLAVNPVTDAVAVVAVVLGGL